MLRDFLEELLQKGSAEQEEDWPFDDIEYAELDVEDVAEAERIGWIERAKELLLG